MYSCHIHFYTVGPRAEAFAPLAQVPALEAFSHTFTYTSAPQAEEAARADVILADLSRAEDPSAPVGELIARKRPPAQLILLAREEQIPLLTDCLPGVYDIWPAAMGEAELLFRFRRWQEATRQNRELWQTSQYLETTINSVPNLVWYKDRFGIHEKVNDSFCRTVNKSKEQVEGRGHAYIWDVEEDDPACIESEETVMRTGETLVSEEIVKTGEGKRLLTTYKSPLYNVDGSVMGTVGVAIDVTRERQYEEEIVQRNHMLETVFTTMDCGVITHTLDGLRILSLNPAALQICGFSSLEELMEQGFSLVSNAMLEEDRARVKRRLQVLHNEGDSISLEYRIRHKNGNILHIMGSAKLVRENGELIYQRFLLDCTEQKLREERAQAEAKRLQAELVQALSIDYSLVCSFDLDTGEGALLRLEDEGNRWFGHAFDGALSLGGSMGGYIAQFVHMDDRELVCRAVSREYMDHALSEHHRFYVNYRAQSEGESRYFELKVVRTENFHTIVLGIRDVDAEVRSEMERRALLEDALAQANRANKAKSVFLSNMSHDIRTPMNAIVGFTSLAMTHIDRKEQVEEYLKKIQTSGNHLLSLINDILDMSRIESGKMQLEEKACSLPDLLHSLRNILQADVRAKQLELQMDTVDVQHEDVYCDSLRVNQILLNLLGNAVKFTPSGGTVSLRLRERGDAPAGYAGYEFCVRDSGIGMSKEFAEHIFEPFSRERTSTVSGIQGTGLGMAITKNIVDMMNGTIEVESEQGKGTQFTVNLILRLREEAQAPQIIPELEGQRALVVDDDFNSCDSVSYMLQQLGLRAEWTLSGKEAVLRTRQAAMRQDSYCVYVVDWLLPDMNGVEVARRIRQEAGEEAPIIVLTAYDWSDIEEEARQAGVTAFCSKPLFLSELRRCLRSVAVESQERQSESLPPEQLRRAGHILLAEDNELNREIACTILDEAGFTVETAENGKIAVEMVERAQPGYYQAVLMDVRMPVMDGYEATQTIRALDDPEKAAIPIIAMTANAFEEDKREALRQGMDGHIAKPIDVQTLFDTLDRILP